MKKFTNTLLALVVKGKYLLKLPTLIKAAKFGKYAITFWSMLVSMILYGWAYGSWVFGLGIVLMILIHEMGHVLAAKEKGIAVSAPMFIPFLGAFVSMKQTEDRSQQAFIAYGGPLIGGLGAVISLICTQIWPEQHMFLILAHVGLILNLFNLLPVRPLDGGQILQVVGPWHNWVGIALFLVTCMLFKATSLLVIGVIILDDFMHPSRQRLVLKIVFGTVVLVGYWFAWAGWLSFIVDIVLITLLVGMDFMFHRKTYATPPQDSLLKKDLRPYPSAPEVRKWVASYLVLVLILAVAIYFTTHMIAELPLTR